MLSLEFSGVERGIATTLAEELRRSLVKRGIDPDVLTLTRKNDDDMDVGSILQFASSIDWLTLASTGLTAAEKGLHIAVIAHCVYDLTRRDKEVVILVDCDGKQVKVRPSTVNSSDIQKAIADVINDGRSSVD